MHYKINEKRYLSDENERKKKYRGILQLIMVLLRDNLYMFVARRCCPQTCNSMLTQHNVCILQCMHFTFNSEKSVFAFIQHLCIMENATKKYKFYSLISIKTRM